MIESLGTAGGNTGGSRVSAFEALFTAACVGLAAGCAFGAFDCLYHVEIGTPSDILTAALFSSLVAIPTFVIIGVITWFGLATLRRVPDRAHWASLFICLAVFGL